MKKKTIGFEEMIKSLNDTNKGICKEKQITFTLEYNDFGTTDIWVTSTFYGFISIGDFLHNKEYLQDVINWEFEIEELTDDEYLWKTVSDYRQACRLYNSGFTIRCESEDGILKLYSRRINELAAPYDVLPINCDEWEYK